MTSPALRLYAAASAIAEPLWALWLRDRARRGLEDPARLSERLGRPSAERPPGPLVWLHGVSVGESLSLLPLIEALRQASPAQVLVTSATRTSAELIARRLPQGVLHQYAPIDGPRAAQAFLAAWRPNLAVFAESELWPNLLRAARASGVRLALVSARMSEKSAKGWRRAPGAARELLAGFDLVLAQDEAAAERLANLGRVPDGLLNLKLFTPAPPVDDAALAEARAAAGERPVLLAASTHKGEESIVLGAWAKLAEPRPWLVLAPRHPSRADHLLDLAAPASQQSIGERFGIADIHVADTLGELGLWFRLARAALIGGSLVRGPGGHNPLEAVLVGCPVITGPHVENWSSVYDRLLAAGGALSVPSETALADAFAAMLDPATARAMAGRASASLEGEDAALADTARKLAELAA